MIIGQKRLDVNSKKSGNSGKSETIDIDELNKRITQNTNRINSLGQMVGQLNNDYNLTKPYVFKNKANVETFQRIFKNNFTVGTGGYNYNHDSDTHLSTITFSKVIMPFTVQVRENNGVTIELFQVMNYTTDRTQGTTTVTIFNKYDTDYTTKTFYLYGIDISYLGEDY